MGRRLRIALAVSILALMGAAASIAAAATSSPNATPAAATSAATTTTSTTSTTSSTATTTTTAPPVYTSTAQLFGCQAVVAPVTALGIKAPIGVANQTSDSGTPCADGTGTAGSTGLTLAGLTLGSIGPAGSMTYETGAPRSPTAPAVASVADIQAVNLNLGAAGTLSVAGPLEAVASYECQNNRLVQYGQSTLDALAINGKTMTLPKPGQSARYNLLGDSNYLAVNEQITTPTSLTENILDIHLGSLNTELIIGQAEVSQTVADPCADTAYTGGSSVSSTITNATRYVESPLCQSGTLLDTKNDVCVLLADGKVIYVSAPGQSPTGGTVISVTDAKKKYTSRCLSGGGPGWILIVAKGHVHAQGTPGSDRILGLGVDDWASGLAGNDCIDLQGGGSSQHLKEGGGNDRDYVLKGTQRVIVGNGQDLVNLENSGGWDTIGNGRDHIYGGNKKSRLDLGRGVKFLKTGKTGKSGSRVYYVGSYAQISCQSQKDILFLRVTPRKYALSHGCPKKTTHQL